ncbi:MAG: prepilin-type N-terminal cleavage/methylation domain-containing protein [Actinomycetota bacterium]|nr:prepilin-type N-terminal cleavage/methylation domain-containing protein [Actinomycetota bacterium]
MRVEREHEQESAAPATSRDRGYSLVEVLVAIVLMGIAMIPIMLAGITSVRASSQTRMAARVESVLADAADRINRGGEGCDYSVYMISAARKEKWEISTVTATYQWYEPASSPTLPGTWHDGACPGSIRPDGLVQKVTITVTSPNGSIHRTTEVVKSDV